MKTAILACALALLSATALAEPGKGKANGYNGQGSGKHLGHAVDAPVSLAGGIPAILILGGAFALAARSRKGKPFR